MKNARRWLFVAIVLVATQSLGAKKGSKKAAPSNEPTAEVAGEALEVSPPTLDFGPQPLGSATTKEFKIKNAGPKEVSKITFPVGSTAAVPFLFENECPLTLPAGAECKVKVMFRPQQVGTQAHTTPVTLSAGVVPLPARGEGY